MNILSKDVRLPGGRTNARSALMNENCPYIDDEREFSNKIISPTISNSNHSTTLCNSSYVDGMVPPRRNDVVSTFIKDDFHRKTPSKLCQIFLLWKERFLIEHNCTEQELPKEVCIFELQIIRPYED